MWLLAFHMIRQSDVAIGYSVFYYKALVTEWRIRAKQRYVTRIWWIDRVKSSTYNHLCKDLQHLLFMALPMPSVAYGSIKGHF